MSEYELYHWGVKGMKWGVRKSVKNAVSGVRKKIKTRREETKAMKEDMGRSRYNEYRSSYGRRGTKRIYNRKKQKGMTYKQAERRELGRQIATKALVAIGQTTVSTLVTAAAYKTMETRAKQAANASLLRLGKGSGKAYRFVTDLGDGMQIVENLK